MTDQFVVVAKSREAQGTGASRRLRNSGWVPAIIYGGDEPPRSIAVEHKELVKHLNVEAFYSHILSLEVEGKAESVVIKDLQRHPAKPIILHADFLRVRADHAIRVRVPLHFDGAEGAPGVKQGGVLEHLITDVDVECLPGNLPEYLSVDVSALEIDETIHLSDLALPEGVELMELKHENDAAVAAIHLPRVAKETEEEEEEAAAGDEQAESSGEDESKGEADGEGEAKSED